MMMAISACNGYVRSIAGILFCLAGPAYLYSIYQTFMHRLWDDHYSGLCELSLNPSYYKEDSILENFSHVPKTFAEDA